MFSSEGKTLRLKVTTGHSSRSKKKGKIGKEVGRAEPRITGRKKESKLPGSRGKKRDPKTNNNGWKKKGSGKAELREINFRTDQGEEVENKKRIKKVSWGRADMTQGGEGNSSEGNGKQDERCGGEGQPTNPKREKKKNG